MTRNDAAFVDLDAAEEEKGKTLDTEGSEHDRMPTTCPKCGGALVDGFGLMGGGYGPYAFCDGDDCDYFVKYRCADGDE